MSVYMTIHSFDSIILIVYFSEGEMSEISVMMDVDAIFPMTS